MKNENEIFRTGSTFRCNRKNKTDGLRLLEDIRENTVKVCFFDPQYRGVLDKLKFGNEGKGRGKSRSALPQMSEDEIVKFILQIERVLLPSGYLFLWVDKFHLCEWKGKWLRDTNLKVVDLITWDKEKVGMGYRTRRKSEYLIVVQKAPVRAKGTWSSRKIPDVWQEKILQKNHPHAKPVGLQLVIIEATTKEGEYVLDPAAGGYSVLKACNLLKRNFVGGDILFGDSEVLAETMEAH